MSTEMHAPISYFHVTKYKRKEDNLTFDYNDKSVNVPTSLTWQHFTAAANIKLMPTKRRDNPFPYVNCHKKGKGLQKFHILSSFPRKLLVLYKTYTHTQ